ncbi:hypothetical protein [Clostridium saccharobutylicum]|uniref:Uncharacterized protein n=1 Tax=Clostridium saccharobutylicum DSM 13864 TaxID=1345695 RepID=U5MXV5_CLOSA|nr:hypothetical protein [Clostridium saccharobutylicum]AGX44317.1 hypothetical protein CLSA_c33540 [Clostridium saccharobutylicum DSM 13864]AQR91607.1 hypothetical protein CLOSC_33330 [Clostridium saccharobutylicum]AQS01512.1 hypothetical protein CSACC_33410 [Clostridium saccharobutylicum]AQS11119.1 hypothetical protein CLOBY_32730 [Clostridium saccharobutylicum]AQS15495.1 hypothetical protein CLOSACC_33410 [Clostridium saccharobutylicum]
MKKTRVVIWVIILIILGTVIYKESDFSELAVVKDNITSRQSNILSGSFNVKKSNRLKVNYSSNIKDGVLKLSLIDSNKKVIQEFAVNSKSSQELTVDKDEEYTILANYNDFVGDYKLSVSKVN